MYNGSDVGNLVRRRGSLYDWPFIFETCFAKVKRRLLDLFSDFPYWEMATMHLVEH